MGNELHYGTLLRWSFLLAGVTGTWLAQPEVWAQNVIIPDDTLGTEPSVVRPFDANTSIDLITGGAVRGQNLFHSFELFTIGSGDSAYFITESPEIANIFARVTGTEASQIFGTLGIRQDIGANNFITTNTDLFLLNPNGIIFGPGARLDLNGTLVATTADSIQFSDQGFFGSTSLQAPNDLLSIDPSALWFNRLATSPIEVQNSNFNLTADQQLLLLGGNVEFNSSAINILGGNLFIGGISRQGQIPLKLDGAEWNPLLESIQDNTERSNVAIQNGSVIFLIPDGDISIESRDLTISNNSGIFSLTGSFSAVLLASLGLQALEEGGSRSIIINADGDINLSEAGAVISASLGRSNSENANGLLHINGQNLNLLGSLIGSLSIGESGADDIKIKINDSVTLSGVSENGVFSFIGSPTGSAEGALDIPGFGLIEDLIGIGDGGNVSIEARAINLEAGTQIGANNSGSTGEAGNISITVQDYLRVADSAQLRTETTGVGNAGNITIRSGNGIDFTSGAQIRSETSGSGNGGNIDIYAANSIRFGGVNNSGGRSAIITSINPIQENEITRNAGNVIVRTEPTGVFSLNDGASIYSNVEAGAFGRGGNIDVEAGSVNLTSGSQIQSILRDASDNLPGGQGETGRITVNAFNDFSAIGRNNEGLPSGLFTNVGFGAEGTSNEIMLTAGSVSLINGGRLSTETAGSGNSGAIAIISSGSVIIDEGLADSFFNSGVFTQVSQNARGNAGDILIDARSLRMSTNPDFAQIFSEINSGTSGTGNSGSITLRIDEDIDLSGQSLIFSDINGGGQGNAGDISISSRSLTMVRGAEIAASVFRSEGGLPGGRGEGGKVRLDVADFINIEGIGPTGFSSGIFANTQRGASGTGGDVEINTNDFRIADGAVITAQTLNPSSSGNITITANTFTSESGGQIVADTRDRGNAGTITLNIEEETIISGFDPNFEQRFVTFPGAVVANVSSNSGVFVTSAESAVGNSGSIRIETGTLTLSDGGEISAEALGTGVAGDIDITTNGSTTFQFNSTPVQYSLLLRNSDISTQARRSNAGNITINALRSNPIILIGDSDITTDSLGDGGNISFFANGVIIALDDSDILAFSSDARGGNITLRTPGFFGENFDLASLQADPNILDGNNRVDINATGAVNGVVSLPNINVIENSLNALPEAITPPEQLLAGSCIARVDVDQGSFVVTGNGGLPTRPGDTMLSTYPTIEVQPVTETQALWQPGDPIVEPTGAFPLADGRLVLSRECD